MKKANELLTEITSVMNCPEKLTYTESASEHPAKKLDEYMKEQYFMLLFSLLVYSESENREAVSYLIQLAEKAEYTIVPEKIVKYVFTLDDKKMQDCAVSFRDEEIKYLLGFELYMTSDMITNGKNVSDYMEKIYQQFEISLSEKESYALICNTLKKNNLNEYTKKENYEHSNILRYYLDRFDFSKERCLVISNCLKEVRTSDCNLSTGFIKTTLFIEAEFISDYTPDVFRYVEKNASLGHFIAMVGGFSMAVIRSNDELEEEEKRLITPKFKKYNEFSGMFGGGYCDDNTYEVCDIKAEKSGVFYLIYNGIGAYNDPFAVISHPLDYDDDVREYLNNEITISRKNNEENK
ncbi:MAG: hypothetical protein NC548_48750 [Lachnospiraceae bacterium]|nr:hypothetical protein [Lachnospiraceae bacterium]MCM1230855.1 hypothetical protein [Ruminococcus flavefaciens]